MDFYRGDQMKGAKSYKEQLRENSDNNDDEDDEDDEDETNDDKTSEGGLIQALINIQLKSYLKGFLPKIEHRFSNDLTKIDIFDCYGMHLRVPEIKHFKGGYVI